MPRHFGRKFVPTSTITRRMDRVDLRYQAAARRLAAKRAAFHALLAHPDTAARLDAMLADNARIDAQLREDDRLEDARESNGNTCGPNCNFCGRCS